ncbi:MAG: prepilin-type N-terminal cleavage/methylation domain-containing protein [Cyanobium sp.]
MNHAQLVRPSCHRCSRQFRRRPSGFIHAFSGFTLIEFLIVVSVLGILIVYAIPVYRQARGAALMGSVIADLISYGKACAVINASGVGLRPVPPPRNLSRGGVVVLEGCDGLNQGGKLEAIWGDIGADGIACFSSRSRLEHRKAIIEISSEATDMGSINCSFE